MKRRQITTLAMQAMILVLGSRALWAQETAPPTEAYFGNLHIHTRWSFDAFINGAATGPDEAYRWAKGEPIAGGGDGTPLQIKVPLDWYVVSDHAE